MAEPVVSICSDEHCFDVQFHPQQPLVAAATITGQVELHRYNVEEGTAELVRSLVCHKKSCRTARFLPLAGAIAASEGEGGASSSTAPAAFLASASADCHVALTDVEQGARVWRAKLRAAGNALLPLGGERIAVGDDSGGIVVYDGRTKKPALVYTENADFISDFALSSDQQTLCATSGDGTLAVYDLRKNGTPGLFAMSDFQDDEFLSVSIVRHNTKVVCGSQTGALCIFHWGDFGDQKDRIKGHPMSVDAMVHLTEDCVLTGSSDGQIRVVSVYHPDHGNRILGDIGDHGEYPVERLSLSPDGALVASASHGQPTVQLWSTEMAHKLLHGEVEARKGTAEDAADKDSSDEDEAPRRKKKKQGKGQQNANMKKAKHFFAEL